MKKNTPNQVRLCLGWHVDENGDTWHAFRLEDVTEVPEANMPQIHKDLAKTLEVPVKDVSIMVQRVDIPQSLIDQIKAEAIREYKEREE